MLSPEIQLFNEIFKRALTVNENVVDYSPVNNPNLPYPFIHIGETTSNDLSDNKRFIRGDIAQTIHVWGYAHNRALFYDISHRLKNELRQITKLENYYVRQIGLNSNDIYDNTTDDDLLHGIIQVEYRLT